MYITCGGACPCWCSCSSFHPCGVVPAVRSAAPTIATRSWRVPPVCQTVTVIVASGPMGPVWPALWASYVTETPHSPVRTAWSVMVWGPRPAHPTTAVWLAWMRGVWLGWRGLTALAPSLEARGLCQWLLGVGGLWHWWASSLCLGWHMALLWLATASWPLWGWAPSTPVCPPLTWTFLTSSLCDVCTK